MVILNFYFSYTYDAGLLLTLALMVSQALSSSSSGISRGVVSILICVCASSDIQLGFIPGFIIALLVKESFISGFSHHVVTLKISVLVSYAIL